MEFDQWSKKLRQENDNYSILFKNSVNEIIIEKTKIANLLNLKFSKSGEFFESRNYTVDLPMVRQEKTFLLDLLLSLNFLKRFLLLLNSNHWVLLPFPHEHCETQLVN